jgi:hypothetical protein
MLKSKDTLGQILMYGYLDSVIKPVHRNYWASFSILALCSIYYIYRGVLYIGLPLAVFTLLLFLFTRFISGCPASKMNTINLSKFKTRKYNRSYLVHPMFCKDKDTFALTGEIENVNKFDVHSNIFTLELNESSPYENGFAHGLMLSGEIIDVILWYGWIYKEPITYDLLRTIPDDLYNEIRGIVNGVNASMNPKLKKFTNSAITTSDILRVHMVADNHASCTCIGIKVDGKVVLGRNMDYMPFGMAQKSIIIRYANGVNILTAPGVIGAITGWNDRTGLRIALNVCPDPQLYRQTMPTTLYNRVILEKCDTPQAAIDYLSVEPPRNAYHLTVANDTDIYSAAAYQDGAPAHLVRSALPILVVNDSRSGVSSFLSSRRKGILSGMKFWSTSDVIDGLKRCQSFITSQSVVFYDRLVYINVDNGYAADGLP